MTSNNGPDDIDTDFSGISIDGATESSNNKPEQSEDNVNTGDNPQTESNNESIDESAFETPADFDTDTTPTQNPWGEHVDDPEPQPAAEPPPKPDSDSPPTQSSSPEPTIEKSDTTTSTNAEYNTIDEVSPAADESHEHPSDEETQHKTNEASTEPSTPTEQTDTSSISLIDTDAPQGSQQENSSSDQQPTHADQHNSDGYDFEKVEASKYPQQRYRSPFQIVTGTIMVPTFFIANALLTIIVYATGITLAILSYIGMFGSIVGIGFIVLLAFQELVVSIVHLEFTTLSTTTPNGVITGIGAIIGLLIILYASSILNDRLLKNTDS